MSDNEEAVTLTAAQYRNLANGYALLDTLMKGPAKRDFEGLVKKHVNPNAVTSDDIAAPLLDPLKQELKELREWRKKREEDELDQNFNSAFDRISRQYELTEDGQKSLKEFMVKKKIADPEDAVLAWQGRQPKQPMMPAGMDSASWGFGELDSKEDTTAMLNDPDGYFDKQAAKIWNDVKNGREAA